MAEKAATLKKREEMELFFGFLNRMGREKRDEIFRSDLLYWVTVAGALDVPREIDPTLEQFDRFLREFGEAENKDHTKYQMDAMQTVRTSFLASGIYTPQDQFLQFLFGFNDKTLKSHLLKANGREGVNVDALLGQIYKRRLGNADEALDPMELFLRRDLRVDILKEWDQNDTALSQRTPAERLPPVDRTQFAGGDGDDAHVQIDETSAEPSAEGTDARVYLRVRGIENLEQAFIAMEIYQPPGDGTVGLAVF